MGNVIRWAIVMQAGGSALQVVTGHARASDASDPADDTTLQNFATALNEWWEADSSPHHAAKSRYTPGVALIETTAQRIQPDESGVFSFDGEGSVGTLVNVYPGGSKTAGDFLFYPHPPQVAWMVSLRTLVDSRRYRGRVFLPATGYALIEGVVQINPTDDAAGIVPTVARIAITDLVQHLGKRIRDLESEAGDPKWNWCVYSRVDQDAHPVIAFRGQETLRTQRNRQGVQSYYDIDLVP